MARAATEIEAAIRRLQEKGVHQTFDVSEAIQVGNDAQALRIP